MASQRPRNPYLPTSASAQSPDIGTEKRPLALVVWPTIEAVVMVVIAISAPQVLRSFSRLFAGFGADVPMLTRFFLRTPWLWSLLALTSVYVCVRIWMQPEMTVAQRAKWRRVSRLSLVVTGVLIALGIYALYSPIFELGREV